MAEWTLWPFSYSFHWFNSKARYKKKYPSDGIVQEKSDDNGGWKPSFIFKQKRLCLSKRNLCKKLLKTPNQTSRYVENLVRILFLLLPTKNIKLQWGMILPLENLNLYIQVFQYLSPVEAIKHIHTGEDKLFPSRKWFWSAVHLYAN